MKTAIHGAHKSFKSRKYARQYLGAFAYRFNHRFDLRGMISVLIGDCVRARLAPQRAIRGTAEDHA